MEKTFEREFEGIKHYEKVSRDHPGLVDVLHVGRDEDAGFYYYVMELADDQSGGTMEHIDPATYKARTLWSDLQQNRQRDVEECIAIGCSLAEALDHLHRSGLIHRDVKPANVIFIDGIARLADIGLVAQSGQKTFVGTEGYVPPEGPGTSSADLYSLAMVLYEMHTGKDRLEFPELPTNHELPPTVNRDNWRALNTVICRAGSPDPAKRFETGLAFSESLKGVTREKNILPDTGFLQKIPYISDLSMNRMLFGASIAGLALTVLVLIVVFWKSMLKDGSSELADIPPPPKETKPAKLIENNAGTPLPEIRPVIVEPLPEKEEKPIVAARVATRSIKLDSVPNGATVWHDGKEIGRTPTPYLEFEPGKLEFVFKKEGYLEKREIREFESGDPLLLRSELVEDKRPALGDSWVNATGMEFYPLEDGLFYTAVTPTAYEKFLEATAPDQPMAVSAKSGIVQINKKDDKWAFCDWLTEIDIQEGYLDKQHYYVPAVAPNEVPKNSFYCQVETGFKTLVVESAPQGANIYEGEKLLGTTPANLVRRKGPFQLRISTGGYQEHILTGTLRDENLSLPVSLIRDRSILFGELWVNSQEMTLIPIGKMMAGIYETRIRDFAQFLEKEPNPGVYAASFHQTPDDPIVKVSRNDAKLFCQWLTRKERSEKLIRPWHEYRLPTDREWSELAGIKGEKGKTPHAREREFPGRFPWGTDWPPDDRTGNFADEAGKEFFGKYIIPDYYDGYTHTSPVGSFKLAKSKLYDLGGNAWEWVSDNYDNNSNLGVLRGGAWDSCEQGVLSISYRNAAAPSDRNEKYGFRYILVDTRK